MQWYSFFFSNVLFTFAERRKALGFSTAHAVMMIAWKCLYKMCDIDDIKKAKGKGILNTRYVYAVRINSKNNKNICIHHSL